MEVDRDDEFAPVKNAPGAATDSPDTARALLSNQAIRWLTAVGAEIVKPPKTDFEMDFCTDCEISPLVSYAGEGLTLFKGLRMPLPLYLMEGQPRQNGRSAHKDDLLEAVSGHPAPNKEMKYGTAGFRDEWNILHAIFVRMGIVAVLRSRSSSGRCVGVMTTASHNPEKDNGIKIVDTDGSMLAQEWEPIAEAIATLSHPAEVIAFITSQEARLGCMDRRQPATVIVGRDTRPHSRELVDCVCAGVRAMGGTVLDLGEVTTPQLHFVVQATNGAGWSRLDDFNPTEALSHYYTTLMTGYVTLRQTSAYAGIAHVVVDGAFGVGGISITEFVKVLSSFWGRHTEFNRCALSVDLRNAVGAGSVNKDCGAEIVQKGRRPPCNFHATEDMGKLMCSYDGDADRIVFQSFIPTPSGPQWVLFDGDKIASLVSAFLIEEMRAAGLCEGSAPCVMGVVQTAYANGASTAFLRSRGIDITFTKTGVKYLHHAARRCVDDRGDK